MAINFGENPIQDAKVGETQVEKIYLGEEEVWSNTPPTPPSINALKLETAGSNSVTIDSGLLSGISPVFEYSNDGETWTSWNINNSLSFGNGTPLYIRGTNTALVYKGSKRVHFSFDSYTNDTNLVDCSGNIMALFDYSNVVTEFPSGAEHGLQLFFSENTSLRTPPSLPALTLTIFCYNAMFKNCTHLNAINYLPATTMGTSCYGDMYNGCSLIKMSETQTGEYVNEYSFGGTIGGSASNMFANTGGTFTGSPTNTTYYTSNEVIS